MLRIVKSSVQMKLPKVLIVVDMSAGVPAREVLSGIFKFVNAGHPWSIRLVQLPHESLHTALSRPIGDAADGLIITTLCDEISSRIIAETRLPMVFVDVRHPSFDNREGRVSFVRNDNPGIGATGAKHLLSSGRFNSYGFVPNVSRTRWWSALREQSFVKTLRERGLKAHVFLNGSQLMTEDRANLVRWLKRLPKPAALMAACDYRATQVCEACTEAGLRIPEQIALVSVDNDELLCLSTPTPLSSIKPDHIRIGFLGAKELNRLFRLGARAKRRELLCRDLGVAERESTKPTPPSATLIRRAVAFIDENAKTDLPVDSVADALGVSRRLLERRFREARGESIHDCILRRRIAAVKFLLRTTRRPLVKIAAECGFANANSLSHIFARAEGVSMSAYRTSIG